MTTDDLLTAIEGRLDTISGTLDVILISRGIRIDAPDTWPAMPAAEKARIIAQLAVVPVEGKDRP